jgi:hypothetical protein
MIDGLKVTLTGEELRRLLDERIAERRAGAERWDHERRRTMTAENDDPSLLPEHICKNEADRQQWRAEVLTFLRDHLDPLEVYRLGESDAEFGELLPRQPGWMEEDECDEGARLSFGGGRYARRICDSPEIIEVTNPDYRTS